jgi:glycosyltransferase involved in cell wall biosynthesis
MLRGFIFDKTCNLLATRIVAVSQVVKDFMVSHEKVAPNKITVVNNSVSEKFLADPGRVISSDKIRIGVVSRLTNIKGVEYIAEAFAAFYLENKNSQLTLVGSDSDSSAAVHEILGQLPPESYNFIPRLTDISSFYNEIDVFIHVPISETAEAFGLVYLESLFAGLYCIFTKSGIVSKDGELQELCKIVDYKNSESILQAIRDYSFSAKQRKVVPQSVLDRYSTAKMKNSYSEIWKGTI